MGQFGYRSLSPPRKSKLAGKTDGHGVESARKINEVCLSSLSHYPSLYPFVCLGGLWVHVCGDPCGVARWGKQVEETAGRCSSHSALYTSNRELVLPCLDKHPLPLIFSQFWSRQSTHGSIMWFLQTNLLFFISNFAEAFIPDVLDNLTLTNRWMWIPQSDL